LRFYFIFIWALIYSQEIMTGAALARGDGKPLSGLSPESIAQVFFEEKTFPSGLLIKRCSLIYIS